MSTHTNTMVWFPSASPQDADYIYRHVQYTHTNETGTMDPHMLLSFDLLLLTLLLLRKFTSPVEPVLKCPIKCSLHLPKKTEQDVGNKLWNLGFLNCLHTSFFSIMCGIWSYLLHFLFFLYFIGILKHFHMTSIQ